MACILILRSSLDDSEQYYVTGTGWQADVTAAQVYGSKEASMVDGVTQREALGPGARMVVKDQVAGTEWVVPGLTT